MKKNVSGRILLVAVLLPCYSFSPFSRENRALILAAIIHKGVTRMKTRALWLVSVTLLASVLAPTLAAQNPNYNNGPVWRVTYVEIEPGNGDAFWTDIKQNFKPIYDEFKSQGWVLDYKFFTNPVATHPNDWSVAIAVEYKSWGTLDEMSEKAGPIVEKHYGSRAATADAARKRHEFAPVLSSTLAREVTLK